MSMAPIVRRAQRLVIWCHFLLIFSPPTANGAGRRLNSLDLLPIKDSRVSESENEVPEHGCWVFHHMVKAGGSTVRTMLHRFIDRNNILRRLYANNEWLKGIEGTRLAGDIFQKGHGIIDGGYVEGLRSLEGSKNCMWFTIFRHPISRLVSAFFYCKYMNRNLCVRLGWDLDTLDLLPFAEKWGNYGLRQYALAFVSNEEILASFANQGCERCPGWYIFKRYLQGLQEQPQNNTAITTFADSSTDEQSLYMMLEPALEIINSKYAAVGILEDMATTMRLFNSALSMDNFNWTFESEIVGRVNEDRKHKAEEHALVRKASTDPAIIRFIRLDLILYEHATRVHAKQVEEYGIGQP